MGFSGAHEPGLPDDTLVLVSSTLAEHILETLRRSLGVSIGVVGYQEPGQDEVWRIDAADAKGERWVASDPDYYRAAVMLPVLMGCGFGGVRRTAWCNTPSCA